MSDQLHTCERCLGSGALCFDDLSDLEKTRLPAGKDRGKGLRNILFSTENCPTCTAFGPFGLVPTYAAVEGAFLRSTGKTTTMERNKQSAENREEFGQAWLRDWLGIEEPRGSDLE